MKHLKVRVKLMVGFLIVTVLCIIVGAAGIIGMNHINNAGNSMYEIHTKTLPDLAKSLEYIERIRIQLRNLILADGNAEEIDRVAATLADYENEFLTHASAYSESIIVPHARQLFEEAMIVYTEDFKPGADKIILGAKSGEPRDILKKMLDDTTPAANAIVDYLTECMDLKVAHASDLNRENHVLFKNILIVIIAVLLAITVISLFISFYISGQVSKPLVLLSAFMRRASLTGDTALSPEDIYNVNRYEHIRDEIGEAITDCALFVKHMNDVSEKLERVADGDLTIDTDILSDSDTIGNSLKKMVDGISDMISDLYRKNELTNALNKAAITFISREHKTFEETMSEGVGQIAEAVKLDRVALWRNFTKPDGEHGAQIYRWDKESGGTTEPMPGLEDIHYSKLAPLWLELFLNDMPINGSVNEIPCGEILRPFGVVSAFIQPVFISGTFWGVVIYEDRYNERCFDEDVADMLRSAAFLCANAVIREEMECEIIEAEVLKKTREVDESVRLMLDAMPIACDLLEKDGSIIDCNEETLRLFGLRDKDEYKREFKNLSPEYQPDGGNSQERVKEIVDTVLRDGYLSFDWTHNDSNGTLIPFVIYAKRVMYRGRDVAAIYKLDMREELKAQEQARKAEKSAQLMFDSMPLCGWMWNRDLSILDCHLETVKLFGLPDKRSAIEIFYKLSPEYQPDGKKSIEKAQELLTEAFNNSSYNRFEWLHQTFDGELIPCEITLICSEYNGEPVILSYIRDLREEKKMLAEINKENESNKRMAHWYESILDSIPFMITVQNQNEKWSFVNASFEKHTGKKRESIMGVPCKEWGISICGTDDCAITCVKKGLSRTRFYDGGLSYQVNVNALTDIQGKPAGYVEIVQDITETERMANEKAKAEAASYAKTAFLSNMSHEMRTPMNAIINMAVIGKNASDTQRKDYAFNKIEDASTHLLGVINDVLDISKIEANMLELSPVEFDFERMLHKVVTFINFRVNEKQQKLTVNVDGKVPRFIVSDDQRLAQVIMNLLSNAVKFTPEGGNIHLDASAVGGDNEYCKLRIEVTDTGIGISPEQQEKLFRAFSQAESGISRKYGGTGLGLVISKRIVEMMDGEFHVESELGKGARFIFTIQAARGNKTIKSMLAPGVNWDTVRVLAVDDMEETREYFKDVFSRLCVKCDVAADGVEALRMIEENGMYDICFIDWRMPNMDGVELTRKIKARGDGKPPVVIMISAYNWEDIKESAVQAGVDKYLLKPLLSSAIIDCVNDCLGVEDNKDAENGSGGEYTDKHMLLVEDIEINREIVLTLLENTGLKIDCAENGKIALNMVEAAPDKYNLIFMDIQMPQMDGLTATRSIRALPFQYCKEIPIIAMTADVFKDDVEKCFAAGMNDHIGKPLDLDEVHEKLRRYLSGG